MNQSDVTVFYEATPNPQSMKFIVTQNISPESVNFANVAECRRSPLAMKLFGFPWAAGIFLGANFVTVTKQEWVDWDILADPLAELIREHIVRGEPVLYAPEPAADAGSTAAGGAASPSRSSTDATELAQADSTDPVIVKIKHILDQDIRPAVAMDGGDIVFSKFEDGRVHLHLRGACSGCPSSAYTLKEGIETRLRQAIPEVREVVSV